MSFSEADRQIFHEEVAKVFGDLVSSGFHQTGVELRHTAALGEYLEVAVQDRKLERGVRIDLTRTPDGRRDALTVSLERGRTDTFTVSEFLQREGVNDDVIGQCKLSAYHGSLAERISRCLAFNRQQIDKHLRETLAGAEWPGVPMNWGDHK